MVHGGIYHPLTRELRSSEALVILSDPDFTRGYHAGRRYYFFEGGHEERLIDARLVEHINSWALEWHEWREPEQVFRFALGCRVGELSAAIIPMPDTERKRIEAEDRAFLAAYKATSAASMATTVS